LEKNKLMAPEGWSGVRNIDQKLEVPVIDMFKQGEELEDD
jgi:hypothetical protein